MLKPFISRTNTVSASFKANKKLSVQHLSFYEQLNFHTFWVEKKFDNYVEPDKLYYSPRKDDHSLFIAQK